MFKKLFINIVLLCFFSAIVCAQELITGLQVNTAIRGKNEKIRQLKGLSASDTLELPFFDDFSETSVLPSSKRWSDDNVFINNSYSNQQITTGIATFDAINNEGRLYEIANPSGFEADHLTSQSINLSYPSSSEIWLSFFYQPGGLGDPPELKDSLTLQFYSPGEAKWHSVWKAEGTGSSQPFKPVIIKIDQSQYLQKGFMFRFVNYASLSDNLNDPSVIGNCDMWNLDYVYLNKNRNDSDTLLADVAFRTPLRSILKTHESMPWKQFQQISLQEMGSAIPIHYRNNDKIVRNVTRNFVIRDVYKNSIAHSFSAGATNIDPKTSVDYDANLIYTFSTTNNDSAIFRITCILKTDDFDPKQNDTIKYDQVFSNYFAFDDGTSEAGYGINGLGSRNAMVAMRFKSFMSDTLRAVSICFNDSYLNSNLRAFDLMIWDDSNDQPGSILYSVESEIVEQGKGINGFYTYILPEGVPVNDVFYIGWRQVSETFLNAGFDINTPHKERQFYWLNGMWIQSQVQGSIMIRPLVGETLKTTSIDDIHPDTDAGLKLWPNPATDQINLGWKDINLLIPAYIKIIDLKGNELMNLPYSEQIDISSLKAGVYILIPIQGNRQAGHLRLVKNR